MAESYGEEPGHSTSLQEPAQSDRSLAVPAQSDRSLAMPAQSDRSVAELVKQLSDQTATLARQELDLAKAELAEKGKKAGVGAGMFGGAAVFGVYALGALTACAILALAMAMAGWLAALIVAAVYALIAGVLALIGKRNVKQGVPPTPEQTIESVKQDVELMKQRAQEGRR